MEQKRRTIEEILRVWGSQARRLPADAEVRRAHVMHVAPHIAPAARATFAHPRMPRLVLAFTSLAIIAVFAQPEQFFRRTQVLTETHTPTGAASRTPPRLPPSGMKSENDTLGTESRALESGTLIGLDARDAPLSLHPFVGSSQPAASNKVPASDKRELLETNYAARIRARHVTEMSARVQTMVRGHDGRIDAAATSDAFASVTLAIPETEIERFRDELRTLAGARFLVERTSSVNRLPEQRGYEATESAAAEALAQLERERSGRVAEFRGAEAGYAFRIRTAVTRIREIRKQLRDEQDPDVRATFEQQLRRFTYEEASARSGLTKARATYERDLRNLDQRIASHRAQVEIAQQHQANLAERVATVSGTVTIDRISLAGMGVVYLGDHWLAALLGVLALAAFFRTDRRPLITV